MKVQAVTLEDVLGNAEGYEVLMRDLGTGSARNPEIHEFVLRLLLEATSAQLEGRESACAVLFRSLASEPRRQLFVSRPGAEGLAVQLFWMELRFRDDARSEAPLAAAA